MKQTIGNFLNRALAHFNLQIKTIHSGFWDKYPEFLEAYKKITPHTLVRIDRAFMLHQYAKHAATLKEGGFAQLGVYKGGTARLVAEVCEKTDKKMYLFDTFEGLPDGDEKDGMTPADNENRDFTETSLEDVKEYMKDLSCVEFKPGYFPDTTKGLEDTKYSFVYLDADLYQSTKDGLEFFYPKMVPGGVILLDDYKTNVWPGVIKAVDEFCKEKNITSLQTVWCQGIIIKT